MAGKLCGCFHETTKWNDALKLSPETHQSENFPGSCTFTFYATIYISSFPFVFRFFLPPTRNIPPLPSSIKNFLQQHKCSFLHHIPPQPSPLPIHPRTPQWHGNISSPERPTMMCVRLVNMASTSLSLRRCVRLWNFDVCSPCTLSMKIYSPPTLFTPHRAHDTHILCC